MQKHLYQAYAAATQTVARTKQIVMLYDGVIRFLQQAKEANRERRIEDRYHLLVKAADVIGGLQGCLDFENGGNIAKILYSYYTSAELRIFSLHQGAEAAAYDEIIDSLKQMRDVWAEIDKNESGSLPQADVAAPQQPGTDGDLNVTLSA